jgi:predicted enzyme related to lactoylglutathione lyase
MDADDLRTKYIPGVPCWVDTSQPDVDGAVAFYEAVLGWEFEERPVPGPDRYLIASCGGQVVAGLGRAAGEDPDRGRWTTYVTVTDADEAAERVRSAGGVVRFGPVDAGPAGRSAICVDPAGAEFGLWQAGLRIGAELVNAPGGWNWSDLHTDADVVGFYGTVFGWEARSLELGSAIATMLTVPGYGDALARLDPTIRERHSGPDVPPGFSDAIGWMQPAGGAPSRWHVTFAAADPDEAAEAARSHGGTVITGPVDQGPVRLAVLADPAGGAFTVSRYQP